MAFGDGRTGMEVTPYSPFNTTTVECYYNGNQTGLQNIDAGCTNNKLAPYNGKFLSTPGYYGFYILDPERSGPLTRLYKPFPDAWDAQRAAEGKRVVMSARGVIYDKQNYAIFAKI